MLGINRWVREYVRFLCEPIATLEKKKTSKKQMIKGKTNISSQTHWESRYNYCVAQMTLCDLLI